MFGLQLRHEIVFPLANRNALKAPGASYTFKPLDSVRPNRNSFACLRIASFHISNGQANTCSAELLASGPRYRTHREGGEGVGECVAVALPGPTVTVAVPGIITTQSHLVPEGCNSNKEYPGCTGEDTSGAYSGAIHLRATYLGYWSCQIGCASSRLHCAGDTERLMLFVFAFLDSVKHDRDISESFPEDAWKALLAKLSESLPPVVVLSAGCRFCHHHQN